VSDAVLEVVLLVARIADGARVEEVDSDEAERTLPHASVEAHVPPIHEAHIGIEGVRGAIAPMSPPASL
jgi:hypothetical protein